VARGDECMMVFGGQTGYDSVWGLADPRPDVVVRSSLIIGARRPATAAVAQLLSPEKPRVFRTTGGNAAASDRLQLALVVNDDVI